MLHVDKSVEGGWERFLVNSKFITPVWYKVGLSVH